MKTKPTILTAIFLSFTCIGCFDVAEQLDGECVGCSEAVTLDCAAELPDLGEIYAQLDECEISAESAEDEVDAFADERADLEARIAALEAEKDDLLTRMDMKNRLIGEKAWNQAETWVIAVEDHCDLEVVEL